MKIGIPKEIKDKENRVALTPAGTQALVMAGYNVWIEQAAGTGSGFSDAAYQAAGAQLVTTEQAWAADLVVKVKEPLSSEYPYFKPGQLLFTFLHLAGVDPALTQALLAQKVTALAYETLEDTQGRLPLLAPMSAIAGNMATLMGAYYLARFNQGNGVQLGRVLGTSHGQVLIIGDGVVGQHAARVACAMGANVHMAGLTVDNTARLQMDFPDNCHFLASTPGALSQAISSADLVVGAVLQRGEKAPHIVSDAMVQSMQAGSVIVDVSIDQGGCVATSRPTSHSNPVFEQHGVIHYCVTNMPGAYPKTATLALTQATLPYIQQLANQGLEVTQKNRSFQTALNTHQGRVTCRAVAEALGLPE